MTTGGCRDKPWLCLLCKSVQYRGFLPSAQTQPRLQGSDLHKNSLCCTHQELSDVFVLCVKADLVQLLLHVEALAQRRHSL